MLRNRYLRITFFFARIIVGIILWDMILPRLGLGAISRRTRSKRLARAAAQFRTLAVEMGGVLIKVGQFFSARVDILPPEITQELSGLQDEVPEEPFSDIRRVVETEFGMPLEEKFVSFSPVPEAAASLGQVHRAQIHAFHLSEEQEEEETSHPEPEEDGRLIDIVVKVQRPDIDQIIATDLAALRTVGKWLARYRPISRRADVPALLAEFTRILYEEIDYIQEGHNAETFAENFKDRPGVCVPRVIWNYTTKRVLALEDVRAIKISDFEAITAAGIDLSEVAERLFETYLQQIFEDGFFHADPHPGNLFVSPIPFDGNEARSYSETENGWQLTFVDFGMVGRVAPRFMEGLRELVIAVGTRDPERMVKSFQIMDVLLPEADTSLLEKAETMAFDRFWGMSMSELQGVSYQEMREISHEFRNLIYSMPFQVPEDLILLVRTIGILSGMCTGLDPDFNLWEGLAPFAQKLISEEAWDPNAWLSELADLVRSLVTMPKRMERLLNKIDRGQAEVQAPQLSREVKALSRSVNRLTGGILFFALLFGGIQLYLAGDYTLGGGMLAIAGLILIWVLFVWRLT
jgi:predicted unusual protein kinase regulating ubiquinone biosynthesis (AarF/ABC1/UbiB family)